VLLPLLSSQVFAPLAPRWGCEPEALLPPRLYPYHDSAAQEAAGSCSVRALPAAPLRSHSWLPLQNPWQVSRLALVAHPCRFAVVLSYMQAGVDSSLRSWLLVLLSIVSITAHCLPPSMWQLSADTAVRT
jgi:hypothetical protein